VNRSNITDDFDHAWNMNENIIQSESKDLKVFEFSNSKSMSAPYIVLIVAGTVAANGFLVYKLRNTQACSNTTNTRSTPVKLEEEVPLQNIPTTSATHTPHRIIIEA